MTYEPEYQQMAYAGDEAEANTDLLEEWENELYYAEALQRWNEQNWDLVQEWEDEWEEWIDGQLDQSICVNVY